jgi:hypothetical protein
MVVEPAIWHERAGVLASPARRHTAGPVIGWLVRGDD